MNKNNTVRQAGGFIIQLLPFAEEAVIAQLEENLKGIPSVTQMLDAGMTPQDMLKRLTAGMDMEILDTIPTRFYCDCCKEKVEKVIISVGKEEIQSMIDDHEPIEVNCHFCNKNYIFTIDELKEILKKSK